MKDDTISRTAVFDAVDGVGWYHMNQRGEMVHGANDDEHPAWYKADDIYKAIEALPSAQPGEDIKAMCGECDAWNQYKNYPQPGWIQCGERLPEHDGEYLVTKKSFGWNCKEYIETDIARYEKKDGWHKADQVLAWQLLPKPYREGGQNNGKN